MQAECRKRNRLQSRKYDKRYLWVFFVILGFILVGVPQTGKAQSIREKAKQHVQESLKKEKAKQKREQEQLKKEQAKLEKEKTQQQKEQASEKPTDPNPVQKNDDKPGKSPETKSGSDRIADDGKSGDVNHTGAGKDSGKGADVPLEADSSSDGNGDASTDSQNNTASGQNNRSPSKDSPANEILPIVNQKRPQTKKTQSSNEAKSKTSSSSKPQTSAFRPRQLLIPGLRREGLPLRVLHKHFLVDLQAGVGYRGWLPQNYPAVDVTMGNYFTWFVSVTGRFFDLVSLNKGRYESSGLTSPRQSYGASAAKYGSWGLKAAWFLLEFGLPAIKKIEPVVRYETRRFTTNASSSGGPVCVVAFSQDADENTCDNMQRQLAVVSSFETAFLGVRYVTNNDASPVVKSKPGSTVPFMFGLAYTSYIKPYQITVGDRVLDEYLFTGRFYGGGIGLGTEIGGGINNFFIDIWSQLGLGAVRLTHDMTLNELSGEDWLLGYFQGNAKFAFQWAPFDFAPSLLIVPAVEVSGASFFFMEKNVDSDEQAATAPVNWDFLYTAKLTLILTL